MSMTGKILNFPNANAAIDPNVVLGEAKDAFDSLVLIGWGKNGELDARASLNLTSADIHWLVPVFQQKLLRGDYSDD